MLLHHQKLKNPFLLSFISGLLLFLAWPMSPLTPFIFIAFVPLLIIAHANISKWKYFFTLYIAFFIWNVSTTWWVYNASPVGAIGAFVLNSLFMCVPWLLFRWIKNKMQPASLIPYVALIGFWLSFEFGHLHDWGLSWPWLTIGNVFANKTNWVQWYSITGVSGGSLWVLVINIFLYKWLTTKFSIWKKISLGASIFVPILVSNGLLYLVDANQVLSYKKPIQNVVVVQPNIDSWTKLENMSPQKQLDLLINTSKQKIDSNTSILVWPETALYSRYAYEEKNLKTNADLAPLWSFLAQHPKLELLSGIESIKITDKPTTTTNKFANAETYYEAYNAAAVLDSTGGKAFYHKSMLVPGAETLPSFLQFLAKQFADFGGTTNGYTRNEGRIPLKTKVATIAPSICYESIYGGFMSQYKKNGANIIAIITNDGWWKNTPGHKQHFAYAKLRAIENRTMVVRSANTGISGFISPTGETISSLPYNVNGALSADIYTNNKPTVYNRFPDVIYWLSLLASVLSVILGLFFLNKKTKL
jgi:apolipoprotein N-acyltransferase